MVTRALYRGPAHVCIAVCETFLEQVGDFVGMPVRERFPELSDTGVFEAMDRVFLTGDPAEIAWSSISGGSPGTLLILPWYDEDGSIAGVGCHHYPAGRLADLASVALRRAAELTGVVAVLAQLHQ